MSTYNNTHTLVFLNVNISKSKYFIVLRENGWIVDYFEKTPAPMPTYLLAMAVADFDVIETYTQNNKMVRSLHCCKEKILKHNNLKSGTIAG